MRKTPLLLPLAAAAALAGCGSGNDSKSAASTPAASTTSAAAGPIKASIGEWFVKTTAVQAKAGKVTFAVTNDGKTRHEFVVLKTAKQADALGKGSRIPETGHVGETGELAPGASKSVTLNLKPGHYALVCNLPGHYTLGMRTDFTVS